MKLGERGEVWRKSMVERRIGCCGLSVLFDGVTQSSEMLQARARFEQPDKAFQLYAAQLARDATPHVTLAFRAYERIHFAESGGVERAHLGGRRGLRQSALQIFER